MQPCSVSSDLINCVVTVKTGDRLTSGTDSDIILQIINRKGQTTATKLDGLLRDDFERGTINKFNVQIEDIDVPIVCKFC